MKQAALVLMSLSLMVFGAACSKSKTLPVISNTSTIPNGSTLNTKNNPGEIVWPNLTVQYITAVPVDLAQIERISKYRSCAGHDRSGYSFARELETDRSMKHYLYPIAKYQGTIDQVKLFAPFDGTVTSIFLEAEKIGGRPRNGNGIVFSTPVDPGVAFGFGHLYFSSDFKVNDRVTAGQLIGYAALSEKGFDFDIDLMGAKQVIGNGVATEILGSAFDHMSDAVLAEFAQRGITAEQMSWNKEYRDAHPCHYNDPDKMNPALFGRENVDWVSVR